MERLGILISKLQEQYAQHASTAQLQVTVQMIQQELASVPVTAPQGRSKISVVLPAGMNMRPAYETPPTPPPMPVAQVPEPDPVTIPSAIKEVEPVPAVAANPIVPIQDIPAVPPVSASTVVAAAPEPDPLPAAREEHVNGVVYSIPEVTAEEAVTQEEESPEPVYHTIPPYDPILDVPTLSHQKEAAELNDIIAARVESLNEKLRPSHQTELGMVLTESPVRDLKKAIGINDRFAFISELFRGDESMYERSLKTINNFHIYPEAAYWMERELKIKLGWDEHHPMVKQFYQLVKRRFSSM
ncbi:MAG: hypothetical protein ACO1NW_19405 [Chitinophagaceae bacterium]